MNVKKIQLYTSTILLGCLLMVSPLGAELTANSPLGMMVKIGNIEKTIDIIDDFSKMGTQNPQNSPGNMIKGMLQGTEWIDPLRQIVIGVEMSSTPAAGILVPYLMANPNFQAAYNATPGPDYYLVSMPPGQPMTLSKESIDLMIDASRSEKSAMLVIELSASELMKLYKKNLDEMLTKMETMPQAQSSGPMAPTPADIWEMMENFFNLANQLENFQFSIDVENDLLKTTMRARAHRRTELAGLFSKTSPPSRFGGYEPSHQIVFRSGKYDTDGFSDLMFDVFGKTYEKMGIGVDSLKSLSRGFTGEMCGGATFTQNGIQFEMMAVLSDKRGAPRFIESKYIPWIQKYSRDMARTMESQLGQSIGELYVRTADSMVAGHKVYGMQTRMPNFPMMGNQPNAEAMRKMMNKLTYQSRMTTVGDLMLVAHDDRKLGQLIAKVKNLKTKRSAAGPVMEIEMDMDRFFEAFSEIMSEISPEAVPFPRLGQISMEVTMRKGVATASSTLDLARLKTLGSYEPGMMRASATDPSFSNKPEDEKISPQVPPEIAEAENLTKKANNYAVYGADRAAIQHYRKAIKLDPSRSDAYFNMGVSLGEIEEYQKAIDSISQAIQLDPDNGKYYFGRGRVHLMAGDTETAFEDFKTAEKLGDEEARRYLSKYTY